MALSQRHIEQWKHNRAFLGTVSRDYSDWLVTVSFYVALHAVDSLLAHDKIQVTSHDHRNGVLFRTNRYHAIQRSYLPLYNLSRTVRYLANPEKWVPVDEFEKNVLGRYLYPIEKSVQKLMGLDLGLSKVEIAKAAHTPPP